MIPLHRPYFGLRTVLAQFCRGGEAASLHRLEAAYAEATQCEAAVWLPSARAGICWALQAAIKPGTKVIGPSFTCTVVHEAIVRAGGDLRLLEPAVDDFLIAPAALSAQQTGVYAEVLSEPYGHAYDLEAAARQARSAPVVRIVDMAMAIPTARLCQRLGPNDFGVLSFGTGKNMYAGWGGIGFARNRALADAVRKIRDSAVTPGGLDLPFRRAIEIGLRTVTHYPPVYSLALQGWYWGRRTLPRAKRLVSKPNAAAPPAPEPFRLPAEWSDARSCSPEWRLPSTHLDRGLALWNLAHAEPVCQSRITLARRYQANLAGVKGVALPAIGEAALSHYTVRVDAHLRQAVKQQLLEAGIYTISLWTLPPHLDPAVYPEAHRVSSEVINLPLSPWMTAGQVDRVSEVLRRSVEQLATSGEG